MSRRVAAWLVSSTSATLSNSQDAKVAVTTPMSAIPHNINVMATKRPDAVTGNSSPYPTVVTVDADHHRASPNVSMVALGLPRSTSRMARLATNRTSAVAPTTYVTTLPR